MCQKGHRPVKKMHTPGFAFKTTSHRNALIPASNRPPCRSNKFDRPPPPFPNPRSSDHSHHPTATTTMTTTTTAATDVCSKDSNVSPPWLILNAGQHDAMHSAYPTPPQYFFPHYPICDCIIPTIQSPLMVQSISHHEMPSQANNEAGLFLPSVGSDTQKRD